MKSDIYGKIHKAVQESPVIIYGAHLVALELYRYLIAAYKEIDFLGFAVTILQDNPTKIEGKNVAEISAYKTMTDAAIMIAMPEKYHNEVESSVKEFGFVSVIRIGMEEMTDIKKAWLLSCYDNRERFCLRLCEDTYDTS